MPKTKTKTLADVNGALTTLEEEVFGPPAPVPTKAKRPAKAKRAEGPTKAQQV